MINCEKCGKEIKEKKDYIPLIEKLSFGKSSVYCLKCLEEMKYFERQTKFPPWRLFLGPKTYGLNTISTKLTVQGFQAFAIIYSIGIIIAAVGSKQYIEGAVGAIFLILLYMHVKKIKSEAEKAKIIGDGLK
jgi:hypothetical protein